MGEHSRRSNEPGNVVRVTEPTQVVNGWRATVRTLFQLFVGLCSLLPFLIVGDGWNNAFLVQVMVVAGVVTKVMSNPKVNEFIETYIPWLSPESKAGVM